MGGQPAPDELSALPAPFTLPIRERDARERNRERLGCIYIYRVREHDRERVKHIHFFYTYIFYLCTDRKSTIKKESPIYILFVEREEGRKVDYVF